MHQSLFIAAATLPGLCIASDAPNASNASNTSVVPNIPDGRVIHEMRTQHTAWIKTDRLPVHAMLPIHIGLVQQNLDKGYDFLMNVSDPASPNYGKHWTPKEVINTFAPSNDTIDSVSRWLMGVGFPQDRFRFSSSKGWITLDATVQEAEDLFQTEFYSYERSSDKAKSTACEQYFLPEPINPHVDFITPGTQLAPPPPGQHGASPCDSARRLGENVSISGLNLDTCDRYITPGCIDALYRIPKGDRANPQNRLGIREYDSDKYAQEDLDLFFANFEKEIPAGTHPKLVPIGGATAPASANWSGEESALDFQLAYPIIWPQGTTLFQAATYPGRGSKPPDMFLDAIGNFYGSETAPETRLEDPDEESDAELTNVVSISYGGDELEFAGSHQRRRCFEFMKLGLLGHTIVMSSGDNGVAARKYVNNDNGCIGLHSDIFAPVEGGDCPFLTSVGATTVVPGHSVADPETAVQRYASGGGFSNLFARPLYQQQAVLKYLLDYKPPYDSYELYPEDTTELNATFLESLGGVYNRIGRAYPDVSANGDNILVSRCQMWYLSGGTSASAPIFASIINRINEERLAAGKSTVGFINPALYTFPDALNDIVTGSNPGCGTSGFHAENGWDPVTGLGTPDYARLSILFASLP